MKSIGKILVPVDFSAQSEKAVAAAVDLSAQYRAPISVVHVQQLTNNFGLPEDFVSQVPVGFTELKNALEKQLEDVRSRAEAAGAHSVNTRLLQGVVAPEIVKLARHEGYDLIVIGTHGRTGLKHALMGSVAEQVVRTASCPVLSLRTN